MTETNYTVCPKCDAIWSIDEIEYQSCDHCGYPLQPQPKAAGKEKEFDFTNSESLH